jgi:hypothetical protein
MTRFLLTLPYEIIDQIIEFVWLSEIDFRADEQTPTVGRTASNL